MSISFFRIFTTTVLGFLFISTLAAAQEAAAKLAKCEREHPKIISALKANYDNGSDWFCKELIATVSMIGTLREDPTLFYYDTVTDTKSTETVYKHASTTTVERTTSTSYESQKRKPTSFVRPFPSYVQQYPTPSVSKACSCYVGPASTWTQYRVCEQASTTTTYRTTFTYTVGKPGATTVTFTETSTKTKLKYAKAPFPTLCPDADNIDYVASDRSQWERGCKTGLNQYRTLDRTVAPNFTACIEKCVDWNTRVGYKQCQAVEYIAKTNECHRINEPGYFAHPDGGAAVATMRFLQPEQTYSDYCATVSGAEHLTAK